MQQVFVALLAQLRQSARIVHVQPVHTSTGITLLRLSPVNVSPGDHVHHVLGRRSSDEVRQIIAVEDVQLGMGWGNKLVLGGPQLDES